MEERILAKKTVTVIKTFVIGDHEYLTLNEAKEAALGAFLTLSPASIKEIIKDSEAVAAILLSKGHKKRGPRKKKVVPLDDHPTLPMPGLPGPMQVVRPAEGPTAIAQLWGDKASPEKPAPTRVLKPRPGQEVPDLSSMEML